MDTVSYNNRALDDETHKNGAIKVIRHDTIEGLHEAMYDMPYAEIAQCSFGGVDGGGTEVEFNFKQSIDAIVDMGVYGFLKNGDEIHVWISEDAKPEDVMAMLAHERGHAMRPHKRKFLDEETKAEKYSICAVFAFKAMDALFNGEGTYYSKDFKNIKSYFPI